LLSTLNFCILTFWDWGPAMRWHLPLLTCVLATCSTPYQGMASQQMTANTYRIVARGNGYAGSTTIQDYTLLKAGETTRAAGATHYIVISASDASLGDSEFGAHYRWARLASRIDPIGAWSRYSTYR